MDFLFLMLHQNLVIGSFLKVSYNVESETRTVNILYSVTVKSVSCFEFLLLLSMQNFILYWSSGKFEK